MAKKTGLGKGLSALLSQNETENNAVTLNEETKLVENVELYSDNTMTATKEKHSTLPITKLQPGKYQPRVTMQPEALSELAESIKQQGLLQPVLVREIGHNSYEIIAGERRFRASQLAGLTEVPVIIKEVSDKDALLMAMVENLQREDLNVLEEARAMHRLTTEFDLTHQQIAQLLGKSRVTVSNCLRLLNLNKDVRWLLEHGDLDMGHARALLMLDDEEQNLVASQIVAKSLSVRETEALVARLKNSKKESTTAPSKNQYYAQAFDEQITKLSKIFKTKVDLKANKNGKGSLVIHYEDAKKLETMLEWLVN